MAYAQILGGSCITESLKPTETNFVNKAADVKKCFDDVDAPNLTFCLDLVAMAF